MAATSQQGCCPLIFSLAVSSVYSFEYHVQGNFAQQCLIRELKNVKHSVRIIRKEILTQFVLIPRHLEIPLLWRRFCPGWVYILMQMEYLLILFRRPHSRIRSLVLLTRVFCFFRVDYSIC